MFEYLLAITSFIILFYCIVILFTKSEYGKIIIFFQVNSLATLLIAIFASIYGHRAYIDIAFVYSLFSFISAKILIYYQSNNTQ
ncbi:MAG: monovalent cation/H+ antiporter complex subunit F [Rickettsiaceae bacterium]|nr:monovalent cation/H+ antiporter complex subunit F [Rickettsiaceae bacterium]